MGSEQSNDRPLDGGGTHGGAGTLALALALLFVPRLSMPPVLAGPGSWSVIAAAAVGALVGAVSWQVRGRSILVVILLAASPGLLAPLVEPGFMSVMASSWGAVAAMSGLGLCGAAVGAWTSRSGRRGSNAAAILLLLALVGQGAAVGWGLMGAAPPFDPELTASLLDLSPSGLVLECGGVDWMRSSVLYEAAGTDRIGPELRASWSGSVAGPVLVVVGCALLLGVRVRP